MFQKTLSSTSVEAGVAAASFQSVVATSGYFANSESSFTDEGEVELGRLYKFSHTFPTFKYTPYNKTVGDSTQVRHGFSHGMCVVGATKVRASINSTIHNSFVYTIVPDFKAGAAIKTGDVTHYTNLAGSPCAGDFFVQPNGGFLG
mmetsp:Transcript_8918/g.26511  ORF Transcript_8918/g.26511 Transcript_8918/m.26511 type:complete len:146 (-) Transcript_8918:809-1246(-)